MIKKPSRKGLFAVLTALLGTGAIAFSLSLGGKHERKEFIGNVAPRSGVRCRFTVASDWRVFHWGADAYYNRLDMDTFTAPTSRLVRPVREWINYHVRHRATSSTPPSIEWTTRKGKVLPGIRFQDGYPEKATWGKGSIVQRHMQIDGYRATLVQYRAEDPAGDVDGIWLLVSLPDDGIVYELGGVVIPSDFDPFDREMQEIVPSFRIEHVNRVVAPTGGKR